MKKKKITYQSIIVFFISFFLLSLFAIAGLLEYGKQEKAKYYNIASTKASTISETVDTAIEKVYTLNSLLISYKGNTEFFPEVAGIIYDEVRRYTGMSLKNIAIAPNGIVEDVYPISGNERLLGFDFMDTEKPGNMEAIRACKNGDMYLSKPFKLVQGGLGMGARLPIYLPTSYSNKEFWGLVTVTIDINELINSVDFVSLSKLGSNYSFWFENDEGKKVILSQSDQKMKNPINYDFKVKNLKWNIEIEPKKGWISNELYIISFIVVLIISSLISMLYTSNSNVDDVSKKLKYLADIDPLTGCYSRNYLNTELINLYDGSWKLPDVNYSLCIIDIDDFRNVNRKFGNGVGDLAIRKTADMLISNTKSDKGDKVIRFGGDSFIILYNCISEEKLKTNLENILNQVKKLNINGYSELRLTVSIGVEKYNSENPQTYYTQVKKANEKLLKSKKISNDRYQM